VRFFESIYEKKKPVICRASVASGISRASFSSGGEGGGRGSKHETGGFLRDLAALTGGLAVETRHLRAKFRQQQWFPISA